MRRSNILLLFFSLCGLLLALAMADAVYRRHEATAQLQQRAQTVGEFALTDLALFTEARYTRHPSQADLHSAFQDHPLAMEHFPSGSLLLPPRVTVP